MSQNPFEIQINRGLNELKMKKANNSILLISMTFFGALISTVSVIILHLFFPEAGMLHYITSGICGFASAIALVYIMGFTVVDSQTIIVIEEYGRYKRCLEAGMGIIFFKKIIEKVAKTIDLRKEKAEMFQSSGKSNQLDFSCGTSSSVHGEVWFIVANPVLWTYRVNTPGIWLQDQINAFMRPILERETLDNARLKKNVIADYCHVKPGDKIPRLTTSAEGTEDGYTIGNDYVLVDTNGRVPLGFEINKINDDGNIERDANGVEIKETVNFNQYALSQIGIEITSVLILDIDIDDKVKEIRMKKFEGEAEAERMKGESRGYILSLQEMRTTAQNDGFEFSDEQIIDIFFRNRGLDVLSKTDANISIIGQEFGSMAAQLVRSAFENREGRS